MTTEQQPDGTAPIQSNELIVPSGTNGAQPAAQMADPLADPRYGYRNVSYSDEERKHQRRQFRASNQWAHAAPDSCLIVGIGNHWKPGSWQAVVDMMHYTKEQGYDVGLVENMDRCFAPYDNLGAMRNEAFMQASQGWDWLLMVDNDVRPQKDDLVRLMAKQCPILVPYVKEPGTGKPLMGPFREPYTGLQPIRWAVLSMQLWSTNVIRSVGFEFWNNGIGSDEGYHFQKLWAMTGHKPWVDTEVMLEVASTPTYPLASLRWTKEDYEDFWQRRRDSFMVMPDRGSENPLETRLNDLLEYLPWNEPRPLDEIHALREALAAGEVSPQEGTETINTTEETPETPDTNGTPAFDPFALNKLATVAVGGD